MQRVLQEAYLNPQQIAVAQAIPIGRMYNGKHSAEYAIFARSDQTSNIRNRPVIVLTKWHGTFAW